MSRRPVPPAALALAAPLVHCAAARRRWRIVSVGLLLAVVALAVMPQPPTALSTGWDKMNHALAFCALGFAWRLAFPAGWRQGLGVAAALLLFGVGIEVAQSFVPGRQADGIDLLADALGGAVGLSMVAVLGWVLRPGHRA
jgi:VanZ family protein